MTWSYTGNPSDSDKDTVRFLVGDTDITRPLVQDEEIEYALSEQPEHKLAAAIVLRSLAAKFSREASFREGDISVDPTKVAQAYSDRADELDPGGITTGKFVPLLPVFGGRSKSEKENLNSDSDAVQPFFSRNMTDIPGGPTWKPDAEEC